MEKLLIIDPHCAGHHSRYVLWIARAALERGYEVVVLTSKSCLAHEGYKDAARELPGSVRFDACPYELEFASGPPDVMALTGREFLYWRLFRNTYQAYAKGESADLVCVPYLDYCVNAIALLGSPFASTPWLGVTMRASFHHPAMGIRCPRAKLARVKEKLFLKLLAIPTLRRVLSIDEALGKYVTAKTPAIAGKLKYLPDPVEMRRSMEKSTARAALGIRRDATVVLSYGSIDARKGIDALLCAVVESRLPENIHVLLAGAPTGIGRKMLDRLEPAHRLRDSGRLTVLDTYLNNDEEQLVFAASDMAWLGYRDHYTMSGVMVQAGSMGLPVIACREGLIGWSTMTYGLGIAVEIDDHSSVASAILELYQKPDLAKWLGENGRQRFEHHTVPAFGKVIFDDAEGALELPS